MEIKITSEEYNNILILKTQGEVNGWEQLTDEIYEEVKKHNCRKIIIDHSLLKFSSSIVHATGKSHPRRATTITGRVE